MEQMNSDDEYLRREMCLKQMSQQRQRAKRNPFMNDEAFDEIVLYSDEFKRRETR